MTPDILDLGSELLVDRSRIGSPYFRLLIDAIGRELVKGSPWVAVNKTVAAIYFFPPELMASDLIRREVA